MSAASKGRENTQRKRKIQRSNQALYNDLVNAGSYEAKKNALERLQRSTTARRDYLKESRALLELASLAPARRAPEHIEQCVEYGLRAEKASSSPGQRIQTAIHLANLPLSTSVYVDRKHPNIEQVRRAQTALAQTLLENAFAKHSDGKVSEVIGFGSEAAALLLLQRYATEAIGTGDYTPVPALLSEDQVAHASREGQTSWDISVFARPQIDEPDYRLQVKYRPAYDETYAEPIVTIAMTELANRPNFGFGNIVGTTATTVLGNANAATTRTANRLTEAMLDRMG